MASQNVRARSSSRTQSIAFVGLTIAVMAVSAWITVPLGPVPFTLQMFAFTFAIVMLKPQEAVAAVTGYLLLGAVGAPVFSGMRGGVGMLAGPTGGFLWGYLFGVAAAVLLLSAVRGRAARRAGARARVAAADTAGRAEGADEPAGGTVLSGAVHAGASRCGASRAQKVCQFLRAAGVEIVAGVLFTAISYVCGWAQYMAVAGVGPEAAFVACIAPFVLVDLVKIVAAVACARAVRAAVPARS